MPVIVNNTLSNGMWRAIINQSMRADERKIKFGSRKQKIKLNLVKTEAQLVGKHVESWLEIK